MAATLYKPQEELDHFEEFDEAWVEGDKEILDFSDRIPEVMAGKRAELAKMDKYDTYEPRPSAEAPGKKILGSTWVTRAKPDGTLKCRFCLTDLKSKSSERTDRRKANGFTWMTTVHTSVGTSDALGIRVPGV